MVFGKLGKKIGEAAQNIGEKSHDFVATQKLQHEIHEAEEEIQQRILAIGKRYLEETGRTARVADSQKEDCERIVALEKAIAVLKTRILFERDLVICTGCGEEVSTTLKFCGKCGTAVVLPVFEDAPPAGEKPPAPPAG